MTESCEEKKQDTLSSFENVLLKGWNEIELSETKIYQNRLKY